MALERRVLPATIASAPRSTAMAFSPRVAAGAIEEAAAWTSALRRDSTLPADTGAIAPCLSELTSLTVAPLRTPCLARCESLAVRIATVNGERAATGSRCRTALRPSRDPGAKGAGLRWVSLDAGVRVIPGLRNTASVKATDPVEPDTLNPIACITQFPLAERVGLSVYVAAIFR